MSNATGSFKGIYIISMPGIVILLIKTIVNILSKYNKTAMFVVIVVF